VTEWARQQRSNKLAYPTIAKRILDVVFSDHALRGHLRRVAVTVARVYFRTYVFTPLRILEAMDLAGGQLSYKGIGVFRQVESRGEEYFRGCVPSTTTIRNVGSKVEILANSLCPIDYFSIPGQGEAFRFKIVPMVTAILKAYSLYDAAKERPVCLNVAMDGANLGKTKSRKSLISHSSLCI
jgi:hypothetical protein